MPPKAPSRLRVRRPRWWLGRPSMSYCANRTAVRLIMLPAGGWSPLELFHLDGSYSRSSGRLWKGPSSSGPGRLAPKGLDGGCCWAGCSH